MVAVVQAAAVRGEETRFAIETTTEKTAITMKVSVFSYPNLNGTDTSPNEGNENANLASIVQHLINAGASYRLDTSIQSFSDPALGSKLDTTGVFIMTDTESCSLDSTFLPNPATVTLRNWVAGGGVLIKGGDQDDGAEFLNKIFGWDLTSGQDSSGGSWALNTANATGTPFAGGPASLSYSNDTDPIGRGTVSNFKTIYGTDNDAVVAVIEYGAGTVVALGFDYFDAGISGTGFTATATQYGADVTTGTASTGDWVTAILPHALQMQAASPTLTAAPARANYIDSRSDDTFRNTSGTLTAANFAAGRVIGYRVQGGTQAAGFSTKVGTYGTLRLNTATGSYTFTPNDAAIEARRTNATENFTVTASDGTASANARFAVAVTGANDAPTGAVRITGSPTQGQTLTASTTSAGAVLADAEGLGTLNYQWQANGTDISGATGMRLVLTPAQVGKDIGVRVRYTDGQGSAESLTSSAVRVTAGAGVSITPLHGTTTTEDGGIAEFAVQLVAAPRRDVTLGFTSSDPSEGTVAIPALTFTAANWNSPQTLRITGVQDYDADGTVPYSVTVAITTLDVNYARLLVPALQLTNAPDLTDGVLGYDDGLDRDIPQYLAESGEPKNDVFTGLDGHDRLYGGYLMDDLSGGLGNDRLYGGYDDDRLYGEGGDDRLYGEQDDDRLEGGPGNDVLDGGLGVDTMIGGPGNDTYYLAYDADDIIDDQGLSTDVDTVIMPYVLDSYELPDGIENGTIARGRSASDLTGNASNNQLTGNDGINILTGDAGNDTLIGNGGADTLYAGSGDDTVDAGAGDDLIIGGSGAGNDRYQGGDGSDTVSYTSATTTVTVNLATGRATGTTIGTDTLAGIENVSGGRANDSITGDVGANRLNGDTGNDTLTGGAGADTLIGGAGNDRLTGGAGNDTLSGGDGADTFRFVLTNEGTDRITDFRSTTDKLQVVGPNFGLIAGTTPRLVAAASQVTGTTPVFIYTQSTGSLVFDGNGRGTGANTTLANLGAGTLLRASDFQVAAS